MNDVTLHLGDCLAVMRDIPDASVDCVLTDPPYGKKASKGTNGFGDSKNRRYVGEWDNDPPSIEYFNEIRRIAKQSIIFGGNYFTDKLEPSNCWIIWDKKGGMRFENPFADCEMAWTSFSRVVKKYTLVQQGFVTHSQDERFHPTQKPTELMRMILKDFTKDGETILDPFMGSGSTGVACQLENRKFIGIEKDENYFAIAEKRIAEVAKKEPLFMAA